MNYNDQDQNFHDDDNGLTRPALLEPHPKKVAKPGSLSDSDTKLLNIDSDVNDDDDDDDDDADADDDDAGDDFI